MKYRIRLDVTQRKVCWGNSKNFSL